VLRSIVPLEFVAEGKTCENFSDVMKEYDRVMSEGHEGIMVKDLSAYYYPSRRTKSWLKLKGTNQTLDVVLTKAKYGKGRLSGYFASFRMAVRHPSKKILYECGDIGGFTDETMEKLLNLVRPLLLSIKDSEGVRMKPSIVIEVSFQEVLHSDRYSSGYSLRNPKLIRIRSDKSVSQIDTVDCLRKMKRGD